MIGRRLRFRGLFQKYFLVLFLAVVVPLAANGISESWFGYRDQRAILDQLLGVEARSAAARIQSFLDGITNQLGWLVQFPWTDEPDERRRIDALRLLRQMPAIASLTLVDGSGRERLYVSRTGLNRTESRTDLSTTPAVTAARSARIWYGDVTYYRGSEPYMRVAISGNRPSIGTVVAEVNLKLIWDVISAIKVGETGFAFVLDGAGRLVAHPDISLVLRGADEVTLKPFQAIREAVGRAGAGLATVPGHARQRHRRRGCARGWPGMDGCGRTAPLRGLRPNLCRLAADCRASPRRWYPGRSARLCPGPTNDRADPAARGGNRAHRRRTV